MAVFRLEPDILMRKKYSLSLKYLLKAYNKGLKSKELYKTLAEIYYKNNRLFESLLLIDEAIGIFPNDKELKSMKDLYIKTSE